MADKRIQKIHNTSHYSELPGLFNESSVTQLIWYILSYNTVLLYCIHEGFGKNTIPGCVAPQVFS